jgi:hypothetical protein
MDNSLFLCYGVGEEKGTQSLVHLGEKPMKEIFLKIYIFTFPYFLNLFYMIYFDFLEQR